MIFQFHTTGYLLKHGHILHIELDPEIGGEGDACFPLARILPVRGRHFTQLLVSLDEVVLTIWGMYIINYILRESTAM